MSALKRRLKSVGAERSGEIPTGRPAADFGVNILIVTVPNFSADPEATLNSAALSL
jgi:hypothetical protein